MSADRLSGGKRHGIKALTPAMWCDSHGVGNRRRPEPALELFFLLRQFWKTLEPPEEVISLNHRRAHQDLFETGENNGQHCYCRVGDHTVERIPSSRFYIVVSSMPHNMSTSTRIARMCFARDSPKHEPTIHYKDRIKKTSNPERSKGKVHSFGIVHCLP